jgi:hypothetical protein
MQNELSSETGNFMKKTSTIEIKTKLWSFFLFIEDEQFMFFP